VHAHLDAPAVARDEVRPSLSPMLVSMQWSSRAAAPPVD
jgi:hypothetical protein